MFHGSQRAIDIMRCNIPEQRRESRTQNPVSGTVVSIAAPDQIHTASVRDLNTLGVFFYTSLPAAKGEVLAIDLIMPQPGAGNQLKISCKGTVVRVQDGMNGDPFGVALQFSRYDISWVH